MSLSAAYILAVSRIADFFTKIRDGQSPERFTTQLLKDLGFASTNDRAFIPLLKSLGFLSADGKPTQRYQDYRDHSRSKIIMGQALREAYGDIFLIKEHPTSADKDAIVGKFKSFHNTSDHVANLMSKTFYALLGLADLDKKSVSPSVSPPHEALPPESTTPAHSKTKTPGHSPELHYNIQIHLPASKDIEVYNSIFKSIREHLVQN